MGTLWICDHYNTEPEHGGYARQYHFARALAARGHKVVVIVSSFMHPTHQYLFDEPLHLSAAGEGVTFAYVRTSAYQSKDGAKRFLNMLSYVRAVGKHAAAIAAVYGKPDTVLGCSVHPFAWVAAYRAARRYRARFLAEVRDLWPEAWLLSGKRKRYDPEVILFGAMEKWAYRRAEKVLYSMDHADRYLCGKLGLPREKAVYLPQPMDCERFDRLAAEGERLLPREVLDFCAGADVCLYTGAYEDADGVLNLLEAAAQMLQQGSPVRFLFVGSGPYELQMHAFSAEHALSNTLIYGRVAKDGIPALLGRVRVCFAQLAQRRPGSYIYGSSKNKISEYLYGGKCTVFAFHDADNPVAAAGAGLTVPPFDPDALCRAITTVLELDETEFSRFSPNGRAFVRSHYEVNALCRTLEAAAFPLQEEAACAS